MDGTYRPKLKYIFEQAGPLDVTLQALSVVNVTIPHNAMKKEACAVLGANYSSCPSSAQHSANIEALQHPIGAFDWFT